MAARKKKASSDQLVLGEAPKPKVEPRRDLIYIIDGSGYIFRAYYAMRRLSTSKGQSTNAVFGFTNMLLKV